MSPPYTILTNKDDGTDINNIYLQTIDKAKGTNR